MCFLMSALPLRFLVMKLLRRLRQAEQQSQEFSPF
jgi:hypothetical protein